jgi:hypothetical protein
MPNPSQIARLGLLRRVTRVSVETMEIVAGMKARVGLR